MPSIGFRLRLALLFVATLVLVQLLTAGLVYEVTRKAMITEGEHQLSRNAAAFIAQMDDISVRVAGNVKVLSLDYALRSAIAERDQGTVMSVLRNHGRRVGASRMLLVDPNGSVVVDTNPAGHPMSKFPFPDLIAQAYNQRTAAVVALDGKASWMVVVPIYAPEPVGLVVVNVPLDDALLTHMQKLSALPRTIELAAQLTPGRWSSVATGNRGAGIVQGLAASGRGLPRKPELIQLGSSEVMVLAQALRQPAHSVPVVALLGYSMDDALRPFRSMVIAWAALLGVGLAFGLLGVWLAVRSVSRPVEALAASARRIADGDYEASAQLYRRDEIGQLAQAFASMTDAVRQREERIRHQAMHDNVTGLPNRISAEIAIDQQRAPQGTATGALLMIGLIRVPDIIKTMGHALCDRLLLNAGTRIARIAGDAFLARTGDAQFALWLPRASKTAAMLMATRVLDVLNTPYQEADISIDQLPAVGIALATDGQVGAGVLLRHAEVAQFQAIGSASAISWYDEATDPHRPERLSLMGDLREAINGDGLTLHYQPKLALTDRSINSAEALLRWNHRQRGQVSPELFIGMAEDTGNIQRLSQWVLNHALQQVQQWRIRGLEFHVAVNLSARDMDDSGLAAGIQRLLEANQVPASQLTVEVTERAVMGEPEAAIRILRQLADQGIGIAIDDFGVGQSSFAYLRHLPVSELKIDQLFVKNLANERSDRIIVEGIVQMSHRLGYSVTAEGVEDQATLDCLASIGCDYAQGYFISRPVTASAFAELSAGY
jgi:diguanylate cyclase (GGDEF)-like protein